MCRDRYSIHGKTELKLLIVLFLIILFPHFYTDLQSQDIEGKSVKSFIRMSAGYSGIGIRMNDLITGESAELSTDRSYTIHLAAGDYQTRFFLDLLDPFTGTFETMSDSDPIFTISTCEGFIRTDIRLPGNNIGLLTIFNLNGEALFIRRVNVSGYWASHYSK